MRIARFAAPEGPRFAVADLDQPTGESIRWLDLGLATPALQDALLGGRPPKPGSEIWPELPLLAPVAPNRVFAIGRNYLAHAKERGEKVPPIPMVWVKLRSAVVGDGTPIIIPTEHAEAIDYEGELAVVIGTPGRRIPLESALVHVAGYTIANDVTARDVQDAMAQWTLPKSMATFAPLGPHLLTSDEIPDPQALSIETRVDDDVRQEGRTKDMIFSVAQLVSFLSEYVELAAGDVIETGTPAGVGWQRKPKAMLQPGHDVEVRIEPIGRLRNPVQAEERAPGDQPRVELPQA
ncbi:MAG TPA: fumarylacetoacetate hydrolase family protein [Candidatus Dormibacteraeota bacterium]|nr:fumarylacetoacetate hydrolase family protein [Candidatus Dormibacteraeota bacterium]